MNAQRTLRDDVFKPRNLIVPKRNDHMAVKTHREVYRCTGVIGPVILQTAQWS